MTEQIEALKAELARVINAWKADGRRKADLEIELLHFIKGRLYGD
jgi:hypothetical protein